MDRSGETERISIRGSGRMEGSEEAMAAEADADVEDVVVAEDGLLMRLMSVLTLVGRMKRKSGGRTA